jgi:hypothetical protein
MKTNELTIQKQLAPIVDKALSITITKQEQMPEAVEILSKLNQFNDKITEEKERITKPLLEALRVERSRWSPMEKANQSGIDHIREQMSEFQTAEYNRKKAEEKKIADKLSSGKITIDKAISKFDKIEELQKNVVAQSGLVSFREEKRLKIVDINSIPREYMIPDEKLILKALKEGKEIVGCIIEIIQTPANFR